MKFIGRASGFETATAGVVLAAKRWCDMAKGPHQVLVIEVKGEHSGSIAEAAALESPSVFAVLLADGPLTGSRLVALARRIERALAYGMSHAIVLVTERVEVAGRGALSSGQALAAALRSYFGRLCTPVPGTEVKWCIAGPAPARWDGDPCGLQKPITRW